MFDVTDEDPETLRRMVYAGALGVLAGLVLLVVNVLLPLLAGAGVTGTNAAFAVLGSVLLLLFSRPTYDAVEELGWT